MATQIHGKAEIERTVMKTRKVIQDSDEEDEEAEMVNRLNHTSPDQTLEDNSSLLVGDHSKTFQAGNSASSTGISRDSPLMHQLTSSSRATQWRGSICLSKFARVVVNEHCAIRPEKGSQFHGVFAYHVYAEPEANNHGGC